MPGPQADPELAGKKVLIVDDDVRNIFALTSMLERWEMIVLRAENGRQALEILRNTPGVDLVLMDIMMPEMDGYETMRAIRSIDRFRDLPIIALTAKAMKDDRQKCIEAGASDYLAKPVGERTAPVDAPRLAPPTRASGPRRRRSGPAGGPAEGSWPMSVSRRATRTR